MTPQRLREILLSDSDDMTSLEELPEDAQGIKIGFRVSPADEKAGQGRTFRQFVLAGIFMYFIVIERNHDFALLLIFALIGYEFAHGEAARIRAELEVAQAKERRRLFVDGYLKKKYPSYIPPEDDGYSVFSVSTVRRSDP